MISWAGRDDPARMIITICDSRVVVVKRKSRQPSLAGGILLARLLLRGELVRPLPGIVQRGFDGHSHLLADRAGDEAPDAVILPAGGVRDLTHGGSVFPAQKIEDDLLLAELARDGRLGVCGSCLAGGGPGGLLFGGIAGGFGCGVLRVRSGPVRALSGAGRLDRGGLFQRNRGGPWRGGRRLSGGAASVCVHRVRPFLRYPHDDSSLDAR